MALALAAAESMLLLLSITKDDETVAGTETIFPGLPALVLEGAAAAVVVDSADPRLPGDRLTRLSLLEERCWLLSLSLLGVLLLLS